MTSAATTIPITFPCDFGSGGTTVGTSERSCGGEALWIVFTPAASAIARAAANDASPSFAATVAADPAAAASAIARAAAKAAFPEFIATVAAGGGGLRGGGAY